MSEVVTPPRSPDDYSNDGMDDASSPLPLNNATPSREPVLISSTQTPYRDSQLLSPLSSSLNNTATRLTATGRKETLKPQMNHQLFAPSAPSGRGSADRIRRGSGSSDRPGHIIPAQNAGTTENELYNTPMAKAPQHARHRFDSLRIERTPTSSTVASGDGSYTRPPQSITSSGQAHRVRQESITTGGSLPATATERSNPVHLDDYHIQLSENREMHTERCDANTDADVHLDPAVGTQAASDRHSEMSRYEAFAEDAHSAHSVGEQAAPVQEATDAAEEVVDNTWWTAGSRADHDTDSALKRNTPRLQPATQLSASRPTADGSSNLRMHPALLSHTPPRKLSRRARARSNDVRKGSIVRDGQPLIPTPLPTHRADGTTIEFVALSSTVNRQRNASRGNTAAQRNDDDDDATTFDVWTVSEQATQRSHGNSEPKSGAASQEANSPPRKANEADEDTLFLELTDEDGSAAFNDTHSHSASKRGGSKPRSLKALGDAANVPTTSISSVPENADAHPSRSGRAFGAAEDTTTELIMSFGSSTGASGTFRKSGSRGFTPSTSAVRPAAQPRVEDVMEEEIYPEEVLPDEDENDTKTSSYAPHRVQETEKDSYVTVNPSSTNEAPPAAADSIVWTHSWNGLEEVSNRPPSANLDEGKELFSSQQQEQQEQLQQQLVEKPKTRPRDVPHLPIALSESERSQLELLGELEKELTEFEEQLGYGSHGAPMSILAHISASREDELRNLVQQRVKERMDELAMATRDCELAEREYNAARARLFAKQNGTEPQRREGRPLSRSSTWQRGNSPDACPNISTRQVNIFAPLASYTSAASNLQSSSNGGASRIVVPASPVFSWQENPAVLDAGNTSGNRTTRGRSRHRTPTTPRRAASLEQSLVEEKKRLHQQNAELRFHLRRGTNYKNSAALRMSTPLRRNAAPTREELVKLQLELSTIQAANRKAAEDHHNLADMLRDLRHGGDGSGNSSQDELRKLRLYEEETDATLRLNHLRDEQSLLHAHAHNLRKECLNRGEDGYAWMIANALRDYEVVSTGLKQQVAAMLGESREGSLPRHSTPMKRLASRGAFHTPPQQPRGGNDLLVRTPTRRSEAGGNSPRKTRAMSADSLKRFSTPTTASRIYAEERAKARREVEGRNKGSSNSKRWKLAIGARPLLN